MVLLWNQSFKPYYKWITFNTTTPTAVVVSTPSSGFKPYYKWITFNTKDVKTMEIEIIKGFKPYYKWITFNTHLRVSLFGILPFALVLNLIINGLPSIQRGTRCYGDKKRR